MGGSESEESEDEVSSGEDRGAGRGERVGGSMAREFGRDLVFGERERRFRVACVGRGLVGARFRDVAVVFADDVRENGGATERGQSTSLFWDIDSKHLTCWSTGSAWHTRVVSGYWRVFSG